MSLHSSIEEKLAGCSRYALDDSIPNEVRVVYKVRAKHRAAVWELDNERKLEEANRGRDETGDV